MKSNIAAQQAECATGGFRVSDTGTVMLGADAETSGSLADRLNRASMIATESTTARRTPLSRTTGPHRR